MRMSWKRIAGGNLRIWQLSNKGKGKFRELLLLILLLVIIAAHSHLLIQREVEKRIVAEAMLQDKVAFGELPTVTFIVEAKTPSGLANKLAGIAGELDAERMKLMGMFKPKEKTK